MKRIVAGVLASLAVLPTLGASAQPDRYVGTWVSESGKRYNVTTMHADGRFRTEQFDGLKSAGTIEGRWQLRGEQIVWTYHQPRIDGEDANALVSTTPDRFSVRERNGSVSTFFRKGLVDPLSPAVLPVAVGTGWILQDEMGEMAIRIGVRRTVSGQDCYRVDWIDATLNLPYQSELWSVTGDGVYAVGRHVLGRDLPFEKPYKLLSRTPKAGEKWQASLAMPGHAETLSLSVGADEEVATPAGTFRATPLTLVGETLTIRRWYAPRVGLVREASILTEDGKERPLNVKNLKRRLE